VLHTLIGYSDQPSVMQVVVYIVILTAIFALSKLFAAPKRPAGAAASPGKSSTASA